MKTINIAVVGATGMVGREVLRVLEDGHLALGNLYALASDRSAGKTLVFKGENIPVGDVDSFDFSKVQLAFFAASTEVAEEFAPKAAAAGAVVIDKSSCFRANPNVPLVIPEVNGHLLKNFKSGIIATPNCTTIQMLLALKPIIDAVGVDRIEVATYQSMSGAGEQAMNDLLVYSREFLEGKKETSEIPMAFNVVPRIDAFLENGYTKEEMKLFVETQKILNDFKIQVNPTAVRVPVLRGHSMAISLSMKKPLTAEAAVALLKAHPRLRVFEGSSVPTPVKEGDGLDTVSIGRVRQDLIDANRLNLWIVSDNLRTGAALNAVLIAKVIFGGD